MGMLQNIFTIHYSLFTIHHSPLNYLAHAYLSFKNPDILVGNMISDFVKGKKQFDYPLSIQKGIRLHRAIDTFTDDHPVTREAKQYFKPAVGLYAGAFVDIVYDHFLALDSNELQDHEWQSFAAEVYQQLTEREQWIPEKFGRMLPYMSSQNWLYNYRFTWGIENSFGGLVRRAAYLSDASPAFLAFADHYTELKALYAAFFPELKAFTSSQFETLIRQ